MSVDELYEAALALDKRERALLVKMLVLEVHPTEVADWFREMRETLLDKSREFDAHVKEELDKMFR